MPNAFYAMVCKYTGFIRSIENVKSRIIFAKIEFERSIVKYRLNADAPDSHSDVPPD